MSLTDKAGHAAITRLTAVLAGMAGSFILFAAYLVVPPIGIFSGVLAPFPTALVRLRHDGMAGLLAVLGGTVAMTVVFGFASGLFYLVQCGSIALLMPWFLLRGAAASRTITWTTAVNLAALAVSVLIISAAGGYDIHQLAVSEVRKSVTQAALIYESGGIKGDDLAAVKQTISMAAETVIRIYPALVTISLVIMAGCNLALLRRCEAVKRLRPDLGDFKTFRNPDLLVWLLIVAGFSLMAPTPLVSIPALNVLVVLLLLYFLQGMAVLLTLVSRQVMAGGLRIMLYLMLVLQPYLALLVSAVGIFDLWGDFRTPRKQENL